MPVGLYCNFDSSVIFESDFVHSDIFPCAMKPNLMTSFQSPMAVEEGEEAKQSIATLTEYLWSIIYMPSSLRVLCLTNLFCWMSLVCYSLYFTDYVGEAVFGGNPAVSPFG